MAETDSGNEVETCQMAMEAAFEKGMSFCESEESRVEVLSQVVGLEGSDRDFDLDGVLDEGPGAGAGAVQTRQWVLARAEELIDSNRVDSPLDAVNQAWVEVSDKIASTSSAGGDGESDEEAAEDAESAEEESDEEPEADATENDGNPTADA